LSQHWWAKESYARSQLLAQIYRIAYESPSSLGNNAEYPLVLWFRGAGRKAPVFGNQAEANCDNLLRDE